MNRKPIKSAADEYDDLYLSTITESASQLTRGIETDVVRHDTTDVNARGVDISDIEAAFKDATGRPIQWDKWDWRRKI